MDLAKQKQYCCIVDITGSSESLNNHLKTFIENVLKENDLKDYDKDKLKNNFKFQKQYSRFECFINFNIVENAAKAVEIFQNISFKAKIQRDQNDPPENWIDCANQADSIIDG